MTSTVPEPPYGDRDATTVEVGDCDPTAPDTTGPRTSRWPLTLLLIMAVVGAILTAVLASNDSDTSAAGQAVAADDGIFAIPFTTIDGGTGTLADYSGRPLVVNFFASWCPPCRAELPDLEAAHQRFDGDVIFIGVNQDITEETWKAFVAESQISYDTVFQPESEIWSEVGTQAMPTTVFISGDGEITQVWAGLITEEKLEEIIDQTLLEAAS